MTTRSRTPARGRARSMPMQSPCLPACLPVCLPAVEVDGSRREHELHMGNAMSARNQISKVDCAADMSIRAPQPGWWWLVGYPQTQAPKFARIKILPSTGRTSRSGTTPRISAFSSDILESTRDCCCKSPRTGTEEGWHLRLLTGICSISRVARFVKRRVDYLHHRRPCAGVVSCRGVCARMLHLDLLPVRRSPGLGHRKKSQANLSLP
ncbi:hypothetical protein F4780DRAFT_359708 [Xylariomycetidae sp. FL0641]|nr:hypothetical protein F4780DRAFT_359708 [Xylariomycetidae sp. FL0641]